MLMLSAAASADLYAEVKSATADGFVIVHTRRVEAEPAKVYATLPAVDRWWNSEHSYSGNAANFSLKAEAGACFCERWSGGEVEHGRVVMAIRDQVLRLQGSLGPLQARAVNGVLTFQLKPDEASGGKATMLTLTYAVIGASGSGLDKSAPAVDAVLGEQFARLTRLIETGSAVAP